VKATLGDSESLKVAFTVSGPGSDLVGFRRKFADIP
jgi:hypothetical protein